jgi:hypothetical protein
MTAQMKAILDGLKKRDTRRKTPVTLPKKREGTKSTPSFYEDGVRMAKEAVEVYEKELKKIK